MKYVFIGDKLRIVKYEIEVENDATVNSPISVLSDSEKDNLLETYPDAVVTEIDNTGYEYLDGEIFTQEQRSNGEVDAAIAMGAEAYEAMKNSPSQDEINAMLLLQVAELTAELAEVKGNE